MRSTLIHDRPDFSVTCYGCGIAYRFTYKTRTEDYSVFRRPDRTLGRYRRSSCPPVERLRADRRKGRRLMQYIALSGLVLALLAYGVDAIAAVLAWLVLKAGRHR